MSEADTAATMVELVKEGLERAVTFTGADLRNREVYRIPKLDDTSDTIGIVKWRGKLNGDRWIGQEIHFKTFEEKNEEEMLIGLQYTAAWSIMVEYHPAREFIDEVIRIYDTSADDDKNLLNHIAWRRVSERLLDMGIETMVNNGIEETVMTAIEDTLGKAVEYVLEREYILERMNN